MKIHSDTYILLHYLQRCSYNIPYLGILHIEDCPIQPLLPVWHIVAGSTGLLVPILYLLFDDLNPALAKKCPTLSEALDNIVVFVLPGKFICNFKQIS